MSNNNSYKILQVIYNLHPGGAERFVIDLSNELSKQNEVILLTLLNDTKDVNSFYKDELASNIKYYNLGANKLRLISAIKLMCRIYHFIKKQKPDIVHCHLPMVKILSLLSIIFYRKPLYVETIHSRADKIFNSKIWFIIFKCLYYLKLINPITISIENEKSFQNVFKQKSRAMIFNGRQKPENHNNDIVKDEIAKYKIDNSTLVLTHIANFRLVKNQILLINAFNRIVKEGVNAILLIIGNGFDKGEGRKLQEQSCDSIYFLGTKRYVADYLNNSNAFVLSSIYEGMPITLIEALACGCIPISTPVSGSIDVIEDNINGFLSADFTEDSFVEMFKRFVVNYKMIDKNTLIKFYNDRFSIEKCAEQYLKVYKLNRVY
jgi:glycosyltransferase involved in cell wall biosynthesis